MASVSFRGRNLRVSRSIRKRNDSEDDCVVSLDWDKSSCENLQEILYHITRKDGVSKGHRLGYLNCFTKFCIKNQINSDVCGLTIDEIFCCLRVALFHDAGDVRAAGLRAIRYLLRTEEAVESLYRVNLSLLICRSIDIVLDNRSERIQALRLVRQLLLLDPKRFPSAITHCLVAIAKDGTQERDVLSRACLATLMELTLMNPQSCASAGGLSAIINCVLLGSHSHNICEALLGAILFLLNSPKTRHLIHADLDLQHFVAPFTDLHGYGGEFCDTPEMREMRYNAAKNALSSIFKSWSGLIYMCRISSDATIPCGIESLINMLHLPYNDIQKYIIELMFELFNLSIPEWTNDFESALISADPSTMSDSWHLCDGFVAAEGKSILPHIAKNRLNLMNNYLALLLYALVNYGVLEALVSVIINSNDDCCSTMAIVLLGELLHLSSCLLPSDCAHQCQSLPTLMSASTCESLQTRKLANTAITSLNRIHTLKKRGPIPCSLYLDQLLQFCINTSLPIHNNIDTAMSKTKLRSCLRRESDDQTVIHAIKESNVIGREFASWDWDLVDCILKWPGDGLKKIDDNNSHKAFIKRLLVFYKPTCKMFSNVRQDDDNARIMCIVGQHFLDFLLDADEAKAFEYIEDFFTDLDSCFAQISVDNPPHNAILNPHRLLSTLSHAYFLFIGRLSSSNKGRKLLEKSSIYQYMLDLISLSSHDVYMKLIVSSLDYTKEGFSRTLLSKVLTCPSEVSRLYTTNYLRVLMRASVSDFRKWAIELLVQQLYDKSTAVSLTAAEILDEACDNTDYLESLISLRPSLLHTGDNGLLLLIRYLSVPNGFKFLRDANYLDHELKRWQKSYNLKYVKIVENVLNECFTYHQRSDDGTYGRRTDKRNAAPKNAFIPPHIYGQLALTNEGYKILLQEDCLSALYEIIRSPNFNTNIGIIQLKAALWAIGHVGASPLAFQLIAESEVIPRIVQFASDSEILSVRGTCYYVLGLLSTTNEGSEMLKDYAWESIRHDHHEKFPLIKEVINDSSIIVPPYLNESRRYTWSISSTATKLPDYSDIISGNDIELMRNESFVMLNYDEIRDYSGSLPSIDTELMERMKHKKKISLPNSYGPNSDSKTLPRVSSLSPNHYRNFDSRPRSSSDCQTTKIINGQRDLINDNEESDCSSGIWMGMQKSDESVIQLGNSLIDINTIKPERHDSGLIADANIISVDNLTPKMMSNLTVKSSPKRKISEPTGVCSLRRDERSDSNESSHNSSGKSRSGSFADSTSGISASSGDSVSLMLNTSQRMRSNNLSPIASVSSISNSIQSTIRSPGSGSTIARHNSRAFLGSHSGNESPISESIPSATDAHGYNTLRAIQKRRVQSLAMYPNFDFLSASWDRSDFEAADVFETGSTLRSRRSSTVDSNERVVSPEADDRKYMGLSLPIDIGMIFTVPNNHKLNRPSHRKVSINPNHENNWKTHLDRLSTAQLMVNNGLELHNGINCLICFKTYFKSDIAFSITEPDDRSPVSGEINSDHILNCVSPRSSKRQLNVDSDVLSSSFASSGSFEIGNVNTHHSSNDISIVPNHVLNRREILRFVTNICSSVHAKSAEQGLLNLKQKCPSAFEDICLYSEICLQLATYNFRLSARRFLQELFLDVHFDQIYSEADLILRRFSGHVTSLSSNSVAKDPSNESR